MGFLEKDFSLASGERVANIAFDDIPPDHWARYEYACEAIWPLVELKEKMLIGADIFCGSGYGAHMLAQKLPCFLTAIDGSAEAISEAATRFVNMNLFFSHKFFPFSLPTEHFDFIVSIESIEHIENGEQFFSLLAQSIKVGGRLIISAPNRRIIELEKNPYHWHYKHYIDEEISQLGKLNGLKMLQCMGADCTIVNSEGKVIAGNYYSPTAGKLREAYQGDTLTYLFEKFV
jgi:cyclopropane fatty-acyl-phospholipid synthase-like methyltransferase